MLRCQMQAYVASDDPDVRAAVRRRLRPARGVRRAGVRSAEGADHRASSGCGMLMNVIASMGLLEEPEPWAARLLEGCGK